MCAPIFDDQPYLKFEASSLGAWERQIKDQASALVRRGDYWHHEGSHIPAIDGPALKWNL